jgi:ABC-2 type transport system ATP-binding protein
VLRVMCGLTQPSRGQVRVLGRNPRVEVAVTRGIGLVPQQEALFERQRALDFVRLAGTLHHLPDPEAAARAALATVELDPDDRRRVGSYSKGMRQRVKLAQALVHDPHVLVLDEPLTGLDPRQRLHMIELVQQLGAAGRCVVVSSHVLDEVERFGSRILVIAQGRLAAEGDFRAIRNLMDDRPRRFAVRVEPAHEVGADLLFYGLAVGAFLTAPDQLVVDTVDAPRFRRSVAGVARNRSARLWEVRPLDEDLESVFRYLVGTPG